MDIVDGYKLRDAYNSGIISDIDLSFYLCEAIITRNASLFLGVMTIRSLNPTRFYNALDAYGDVEPLSVVDILYKFPQSIECSYALFNMNSMPLCNLQSGFHRIHTVGMRFHDPVIRARLCAVACKLLTIVTGVDLNSSDELATTSLLFRFRMTQLQQLQTLYHVPNIVLPQRQQHPGMEVFNYTVGAFLPLSELVRLSCIKQFVPMIEAQLRVRIHKVLKCIEFCPYYLLILNRYGLINQIDAIILVREALISRNCLLLGILYRCVPHQLMEQAIREVACRYSWARILSATDLNWFIQKLSNSPIFPYVQHLSNIIDLLPTTNLNQSWKQIEAIPTLTNIDLVIRQLAFYKSIAINMPLDRCIALANRIVKIDEQPVTGTSVFFKRLNRLQQLHRAMRLN